MKQEKSPERRQTPAQQQTKKNEENTHTAQKRAMEKRLCHYRNSVRKATAFTNAVPQRVAVPL